MQQIREKLKENWKEVKLFDLVEKMKTGGTPLSSRKDFYGGEIPFLKIQDMTRNGRFIFDTKTKITENGLKNSSSWLIPKNSILYSIYATVGEVAINKIDLATNQAIMGIIPKESKVDRDFLYYSLLNYKKKIAKYFKETTQKNLTSTIVNDLEIGLPEMTIQKRIAGILSKVDEDIEKTDEVIKKTEEMKKGLMQELFTKGIGHKKFKKTKLGMIPEEWEVKSISDVAKVLFSNVDKKTKDDEIPVQLCNYMDVYKNNYITSSLDFMQATARKEEIEKFRLHKNDVLITKDSETANDIAVPAVVAENIKNLLCGYHLAILRPKEEIIDGIFLMNLLRSENMHDYFSRLSNGSTRFGLATNAINNAMIPIPKIDEQLKIANILSRIDEKIDGYKKTKSKLETLKKGLMQDLLSADKI